MVHCNALDRALAHRHLLQLLAELISARGHHRYVARVEANDDFVVFEPLEHQRFAQRRIKTQLEVLLVFGLQIEELFVHDGCADALRLGWVLVGTPLYLLKGSLRNETVMHCVTCRVRHSNHFVV